MFLIFNNSTDQSSGLTNNIRSKIEESAAGNLVCPHCTVVMVNKNYQKRSYTKCKALPAQRMEKSSTSYSIAYIIAKEPSKETKKIYNTLGIKYSKRPYKI